MIEEMIANVKAKARVLDEIKTLVNGYTQKADNYEEELAGKPEEERKEDWRYDEIQEARAISKELLEIAKKI